ncbi:Low temperature requirement protein LtrA [Micromonospora narathiwatensis]|uniref:Low temperature requirement protein LtrA n=1 Tax=Micromonospora narathiwatensis TaxID=299146 RepID=A0A1A8ZZV5_9ACTN|nr:Low temperature requirement protein LtrA [Micromonospora narathiwatensis]
MANPAQARPLRPVGRPASAIIEDVRRVRADGALRPGRLAARFALRPPRRSADETGQRHATWLELFFDLVFVLAMGAVVGRLDHVLVPSLPTLLAAGGLFVVVQFAWAGQVFYDTRYDPDDTQHRLLVLVAVAGAGALTLGVSGAPHSVLLPVGYLVVRGVLLLLYLRARPSSAAAREVATVYLTGFGVGWLIWLASLAVPASVRPAVWAVAMTVELATPWLGLRRLSRSPVDVVHLPERMGQFAIIVLGSALANVLAAVPIHPGPRMAAAAAAAFAIPASVWWVYTTFINTGLALTRLRGGQRYAYLHLPMSTGLLLLGWSLGEVLRQIDANARTIPLALRLILAASLVAWMLCGLGLNWLSARSPGTRRIALTGGGIGAVTAIAVAVPHPFPMLLLVAATLGGYAVLLSRHLVGMAKAS